MLRTGDDSDETRTATRRAVIEAAGAGLAMGALAALFSTGAAARDTTPDPTGAGDDPFDIDRTNEAVYPQSVASGGPTPEGAIVWTRITPAAYEGNQKVGLQVAPATDRRTPNEEAEFGGPETRHFRVPGRDLTPENDYTLSVDLDGELDDDRFYFYRLFEASASWLDPEGEAGTDF